MPDQAPTAPEEVIYQWVEDSNNQRYGMILAEDGDGTFDILTQGTKEWGYESEQERIDVACTQINALAKENAELRAENERLTNVIEKGHEEWRMNAE